MRRKRGHLQVAVAGWVAIALLVLGLGGCVPAESLFVATGTVLRSDTGSGLADVEVTFSGSAPPVKTAPDGSWSQEDLLGEVVVTAAKSGWSFQPLSRTVSERNRAADFAATKSEGPVLSSLEITPAMATVQPYARNRFLASGSDQYGDPMGVNPSWSVVAGGGTFWPLTGPSVEYTATAEGRAEIQATEGEISARATLLIVAITTPGPTPGPEPEPHNYVGSRNSDVFHRPSCSYVNQIHPENKVYFGSREEALGAGYRPCKRCNP
jgi:hypothetical protein